MNRKQLRRGKPRLEFLLCCEEANGFFNVTIVKPEFHFDASER